MEVVPAVFQGLLGINSTRGWVFNDLRPMLEGDVPSNDVQTTSRIGAQKETADRRAGQPARRAETDQLTDRPTDRQTDCDTYLTAPSAPAALSTAMGRLRGGGRGRGDKVLGRIQDGDLEEATGRFASVRENKRASDWFLGSKVRLPQVGLRRQLARWQMTKYLRYVRHALLRLSPSSLFASLGVLCKRCGQAEVTGGTGRGGLVLGRGVRGSAELERGARMVNRSLYSMFSAFFVPYKCNWFAGGNQRGGEAAVQNGRVDRRKRKKLTKKAAQLAVMLVNVCE